MLTVTDRHGCADQNTPRLKLCVNVIPRTLSIELMRSDLYPDFDSFHSRSPFARHNSAITGSVTQALWRRPEEGHAVARASAVSGAGDLDGSGVAVNSL